MAKNYFRIEKNKNTSKVLSMVTAGLPVRPVIDSERSNDHSYLFEVTFEDYGDYQKILDRIDSLYNFPDA